MIESNKAADLFRNSNYHMADVSGKLPTFRRAIAMGNICVGKAAFMRIKERTLPKGDALVLAEIAGINGAKNASANIPMCHPLPLDHVAIHTELDEENSIVVVYCLAAAFAKTGVEMEALAGASAALLTIYDLTKPVEPALTITGIRLLLKEGGKKGCWIHPDGVPEHLKGVLPSELNCPLEGISAAVVTLSDRASEGVYEDKSGKILQDLLKDLGAEIKNYKVLPDDREKLVTHLKQLADSGDVQLVITTGGTGLSPRDITTEAIEEVSDRLIPGIGEMLRSTGAQHISSAWLSRSIAGTIGSVLIVALPGSSNAVKEGMEVLKAILPHALDTIAGRGDKHHKHLKTP